MTAAAYLGYVLAIAGVACVGVALAQMAKRNVNQVATKLFVKLVGERHLDRALKLCHATNDTTYLRAISAAIHAGATAGTTDRAMLQTAIEHAFDDAGRRRATAWRRALVLGALASAVSLAGAAIVVASTGVGKHAPSTGAIALGAIALFGGLGCALRIGQFDRALSGARAHLVPMIVDAFATGATLTLPTHVAP